jgi:hypothetical protein
MGADGEGPGMVEADVAPAEDGTDAAIARFRATACGRGLLTLVPIPAQLELFCPPHNPT